MGCFRSVERRGMCVYVCVCMCVSVCTCTCGGGDDISMHRIQESYPT